MLFGDHVLSGWKQAGLLFPSTVTGILRTIKATMIHRRLGTVPATEMPLIDRALADALGLTKKR